MLRLLQSILFARREDRAGQHAAIGGPLTGDNVVALRTAGVAGSSSGSGEQVPFKAIDDQDDTPTAGELLGVTARLQASDGAGGFKALRTQSATVAALTDSASGALVVAKKTDWQLYDDPGGAQQATVVRAAPGAGSRHVITGLHVAIGSDNGTASMQFFELVIGGVSVMGIYLALPDATGAGDGHVVNLVRDGLSIVAGDDEEVELRGDAASPANVFQTVQLTGYTTGP